MGKAIQMDVKSLASIQERTEIIEEWKGRGLSFHDFDSIREEMLSDDSEKQRWFGVVDKNNGMIIAIFDVRCVPLESPQYHKSMRIHFAPGLNPEDWDDSSGQSLDNIENIITKTVSAMSFAFRHLVEEAEQTDERLVKIYCEHPLRLLMFQEFARNLVKAVPDAYEVCFYKSWVEIRHTQGGRHGSCGV